MTPDRIKALREARGWSVRQLAEVLALGKGNERKVRYAEMGVRPLSGAEVRLLEMLERGELPKRYLPAPARVGRPPKEKGAA